MFVQIWIKPPKKPALSTNYSSKEFSNKFVVSYFKLFFFYFSEYLWCQRIINLLPGITKGYAQYMPIIQFKGQMRNSKNSKHQLSFKKYLTKNEFENVKNVAK